MAYYRYVKQVPVTLTLPVLPFISMILGFSLMSWVIWPILSQLSSVKTFGIVTTPIADEVAVAQAKELTDDVDFTKASNWFPQAQVKSTATEVNAYTLSIPELKIKNAYVKVGADDLSKSLIHYGGTGLPGKNGTAVVFGHSILPAFYDPNSFIAMFSTLYTLKEGDDIYINFDGVDYKYKVVSRKITTPSDVSGLEQRFDGSYLTLVTCFPSGTYAQRLWLTAKEVPFGFETP